MKKKIEDKHFLNTDFNFQKRSISDQIKTTNINILLNRVKIKKKDDFKKKLYLFSMMSLVIIFFLGIITYI